MDNHGCAISFKQIALTVVGSCTTVQASTSLKITQLIVYLSKFKNKLIVYLFI